MENLTSPAWWIGIVIVGILINLVSAYLKPKFDLVLGSMSQKWAERSEKKRQQKKELLTSLINYEHRQTLTAIRALRSHIRSVLNLVFAVLFLVLGGYFPSTLALVQNAFLMVGVIYLILGFFHTLDAINLEALVSESQQETPQGEEDMDAEQRPERDK
jgi:hypothetical protein